MARPTTTAPNSQACLSCRSKHLKCDARQPVCDRCATNRLECVYVRSRRGYVGGRGRQTPHQLATPDQSSEDQQRMRASVLESRASESTDTSPENLTLGSTITNGAEPQILSDLHNDRLVSLYYRYIHPSHPFLIPLKLLRQDPNIIPTYLKSAIRFVSRPLYESRLWDTNEFQIIFDASSTSDGFRVQTLLLLTIAAYAHGERVHGNKAIREAIKIAYQIGLDSDDFDDGYSPMLQESWRRTWWELYSICGMLRVLTPALPKLQAPYNRTTPCHDAAYESCQPTLSRNLNQMQERHFAEDDFHYSSFAYRVEAVRILNEVLDFASQDSLEVQSSLAFNTHRAAIRSYLLSLPVTEQNVVDSMGKTEELMFCALTTINLASILLNLPRSSLPTTQSFNTICQTKRATVFTYDNKCTVAAIGAADSIVQLLIDRSPESTQSTSPCFSCVLTFAATVHLLAYCHGQDQERARRLREYFQVSLGALNATGQIWPVARIVKGQLAQYAREIFANRATDHSEGQMLRNAVSATQPPEAICDSQDDLWLQDFVNTELNFYLPT